MEQLLNMLHAIPEYASALASLRERQSAAVTGIGQINRSHLIAGLNRDLNSPLVVLCQDDMAARRLQEELKGFLGDEVPILPGRDLTLYDAAVVSRAWEQKRLRQLYDLSQGRTKLQIVTWESLSLRTMPRDVLLGAAFTLSVGQEYPMEELLRRLHRRRLDAHYEIYRLQERLRQLEADILRMEGTPMAEKKYEVILMPDPEQTVLGIRRTVPVSEFHDLFQELRREIARRGMKQAGPIQMLYHGQEFSYERADVEAQVVVEAGTPGAGIKPAYDTCAVVLHKGSYEGIPGAYEALAAWMAQHPEYRICGPAIDRYLNDPDTTPPEELVTGILFPVEKI